MIGTPNEWLGTSTGSLGTAHSSNCGFTANTTHITHMKANDTMNTNDTMKASLSRRG